MPLKFTADVQEAWNITLGDPTKAALADRVNDLLDILEADPTDPRVRRRRFSDPPLWCFTVRSPNDDCLILWALDDDGDPVVVHIGPSSFA